VCRAFDVFDLDLPIRVSYSAMIRLKEVVAKHFHLITDQELVTRWTKLIVAVQRIKQTEVLDGVREDIMLVRLGDSENPLPVFGSVDEDDDGEEEAPVADERAMSIDTPDVDDEGGVLTRSQTTKKDVPIVVDASPVDKGKKKRKNPTYLAFEEGKHWVWAKPVRRGIFAFSVVLIGS
jgi:hypothetical protein